jgi:hypothetical protein
MWRLTFKGTTSVSKHALKRTSDYTTEKRAHGFALFVIALTVRDFVLKHRSCFKSLPIEVDADEKIPESVSRFMIDYDEKCASDDWWLVDLDYDFKDLHSISSCEFMNEPQFFWADDEYRAEKEKAHRKFFVDTFKALWDSNDLNSKMLKTLWKLDIDFEVKKLEI